MNVEIIDFETAENDQLIVFGFVDGQQTTGRGWTSRAQGDQAAKDAYFRSLLLQSASLDINAVRRVHSTAERVRIGEPIDAHETSLDAYAEWLKRNRVEKSSAAFNTFRRQAGRESGITVSELIAFRERKGSLVLTQGTERVICASDQLDALIEKLTELRK